MKNYALAQEWSRDNEGALAFLAELDRQDPETVEIISSALLRNTFLRGPALARLWNICNNDMASVLRVCEQCPGHLLQKAVSINHSGKRILTPYLK